MNDLVKRYGKGASLLLRMGYVPGRGLGSQQQGIVEPVMPVLRTKGEGIKVEDGENQMKSLVADDWGISSSDEEKEEKAEVQRGPLSFNRSGYDIPDMKFLINELNILKIGVPKEVLELRDDEVDLQLKNKLWHFVKNKRMEQNKQNYLINEIESLDNSIFKIDKEVQISEKVVTLINEADEELLLEYFKANSDIKLLAEETKQDILELVISKLIISWSNYVDKCDFSDLESFSELIALAEKYQSCCHFLIPRERIITKAKLNDGLGINKTFIHLNLMESLILIPLYEKLHDYYSNDWDPINFNTGVGVFEELTIDSKLFSPDIIENIFTNGLIIPRLLRYLKDGGDEINMLEWFTVFVDKKASITLLDFIVDRYIERIAENYCADYNEINKWISLIPDRKIQYSNKIFRQIIIKNVNHFRNEDIFSYDNVVDFVKRNTVLLTLPIFDFIEFKQSIVNAVIQNELINPLLKELEKAPIEEQVEFWRYWTNVLSQLDVLNFEILSDIKIGWQFINKTQGQLWEKFEPLVNINRQHIYDIEQIIDKAKQFNNKSFLAEVDRKTHVTMKEIVFEELAKDNICIIPDKANNLGLNTFKVLFRDDSKFASVYFKDDIIWSRTDGQDYYPISLAQLKNLVM